MLDSRSSTWLRTIPTKTMSQDALSVLADTMLQHIREAAATIAEGDFVVSLPVYLDAQEVHLLQLKVNRRSRLYFELQHRPGERRVGVRLILPSELLKN